MRNVGETTGPILWKKVQVPLLGEWGGLTEGNHVLLDLNKKYLRSIRDYILENKYQLHHTFWCINNDSADTGGLLTRDEGTPFPEVEIINGTIINMIIISTLPSGRLKMGSLQDLIQGAPRQKWCVLK